MADYLDKFLDSLIKNAPTLLSSGGKAILTQQTAADELKTEREKLEVQREEIARKRAKDMADLELQRQEMQINLAIQAINANIAAAEDREFEAQQMMEQQKMSRGTAQDVTGALANIVSQTRAGIK